MKLRASGPARLPAEPADASRAERPDDATLLARLRDDDAAALDALLERHWAALCRYVVRTTGSQDAAADVAQEAFCRLWEMRATWRLDGSVRGLLFRLARNAAVSEHRREQARERAAGTYAELTLDPKSAVLPAERAELRDAIEDAVEHLPARRREVFTLRMVDDLSYDEIAEVMGTSRQTVANQLSRALATLRDGLRHMLD
jgi:RNA polymerase sigma-70 factor (ECF subfamily)